MPSKALTNLSVRMKDIDQLINAHAAITKFSNAEKAAKSAGGLSQLVNIVNALISNPGKGRPKEVDAINRAALVLCIAHFQGFVDELHAEVGNFVLKGKVSDPAAVIKLVKPPRANPHVHIISQMFAGLAMYDMMDAISWQKCDNKTVKSRLTSYIELRNKISHGGKAPVTKAKVVGLKEYVELLADKLDQQARLKATALTGSPPW